MVQNVEFLRGIAAISVALYHLRIGLDGMTSPTASWIRHVSEFGAVGLDLFFIISGFVMVISTQKLQGGVRDSLRFMVRRLFRVVPLYWVSVTIMVGLLYLYSGKLPSVYILLKNYSFQYFDILAEQPNYPLYMPGWTLTFELFFYGVFALGLCAGRGVCFVLVPAVLAALAMVGHSDLIERADHSVVKFIFHPIHLEFVYGIILGIAYGHGFFRLPKAMALIGIFAGIAIMFQLWSWGYHKEINPFSGGLLVLMLMVCSLVAEQSHLFRIRDIGIGRISYSVYLMHLNVFNGLTIFLVLCLRNFPGSGETFMTYRFGVYLLSLLLIPVLATLTCRYIELPFQRSGKILSTKIY